MNKQGVEKVYSSAAEYSEWNFVGPIEEYEDYHEFIKYLRTAGDRDVIVINMNSPGGDVSVGTMIVNAIRQCPATIICNVVYNSYSMGAIIAISCDDLIIQKHQYLMFHTYSGGTRGKSGDMIQEVNNSNISLRGMWDEIMRPFFTKKELDMMHKGDDKYIHWNCPSLEDRIKRHFKSVKVGSNE